MINSIKKQTFDCPSRSRSCITITNLLNGRIHGVAVLATFSHQYTSLKNKPITYLNWSVSYGSTSLLLSILALVLCASRIDPTPLWLRDTDSPSQCLLWVSVFLTLSHRGCWYEILKQLSRSKVKVRCHQNLTTSSIRHNTHYYRVTSISDLSFFSFCVDKKNRNTRVPLKHLLHSAYLAHR